MQRNQYIDGLDGLRTLAVAVVILYHLNYAWAPGGLLGVGIFFVLSGYLITGILLRQWEQHQRLDFKDFWIRRAKRLLPALFTMLIAVIVWSYLKNQQQLPVIRADSLAAVLYVSNWWYIFHDVSYFQSFGPPSPFEHLWSLAVEEQFYLLFPLLLWLGLRWKSNSKWLLGFSLILAIVSACLMAWLYKPGVDPSRVYFGTDTRAFALLIGCGLAFLYPSHKLKESMSKRNQILLDCLGTVCLISLLGFIFGMNEYNSFLFRGGLVLISLITAILIGVMVQPTSVLGKIFAWKPLKWLGERSYGIYLWHFPVIVLSNPVNYVDGIHWTRLILQVLVTIGLAAISYRWIENPIRHGKLSRPVMVKSSVAILIGIIFLMLPIQKTEHDSIAAFSPTKEEIIKPIPTTPAPNATANTEPTAEPTPEPQTEQTTPNTDPTSNPAPEQTPAEIKVTAIGDSVMINLEPYLKQLIPGIIVDGKVGRQLIQAIPEVSVMKSNGNLGNVIIIQLGTNGPFTMEQLQSLYQALGTPKQVIFINTRVPRPWESEVNQTLAKFVFSTPQTNLVDWYTLSANQPSYFAPDGVHPSTTGAQVLANEVFAVIEK
ncbi:acyltransferase family protein [Bacillus sp. DNRA2]|uniref:acyltransferase family protein n=1 Tax=Bacillus sp. DNRA2 TaxID=2723053 RepID=UPI00145E7F1A|nr:acyltransferase family protein [Bacillus sp. DNRA2]NMD71759.1 acyltransferase family protein [Bacillus sp. DNRA2]